MTTKQKYGYCPKCGYTYMGKSVRKCPKCGVDVEKWRKRSPFVKLFYGMTILIFLLMAGVTYLYFTNDGVANEFRQLRQPKPNQFIVCIDVSATIDPNLLEAVKSNLIDRLGNFIGDRSVSYQVYTFGSPGCGMQSVSQIVNTQSPDDEATFQLEVASRIEKITVSKVPTKNFSKTPLTTPLYCLMEKVLRENVGGRLIFMTDMMNDDSDCARQFAFPQEAILLFGSNLNGQMIFLYPTPRLTDKQDLNEKILQRQEAFHKQVMGITMAGKVRSFFYHIPDNAEKQGKFIASQLKNAIPATEFEIIKERISKVVDTLVSAVRG